MDKKIVEFKKLLDKSNKILLINHIRMDPDAFGSLGAYYHILKKIGKEVKATNDMNPPKNFDFLNSSEIIEVGLDIEKYNPELIISFDAASTGQLGETYIKYEKLFKEKDFVVIDHHMTNPGFGSLNIVNPDFSSTCELAFYILEKFNLVKYIEEKEATLLTAGIHTDTNVFYNQNTSPETLRTAAKLMELGADFRSPMYNFFQKSTFNKTKLVSIVFDNLQKTNDGRIVWSKITKKDFEKTFTGDEDTSGIINRLINIEGVEVAFFIYELGDIIKGSFRSKDFSVGDFCASFPGGGGHKNAAGLRSELSLEELEKEILSRLKKQGF